MTSYIGHYYKQKNQEQMKQKFWIKFEVKIRNALLKKQIIPYQLSVEVLWIE